MPVYVEPVFRPPSQARSLIFQITVGCSQNQSSSPTKRPTALMMPTGQPALAEPPAASTATTVLVTGYRQQETALPAPPQTRLYHDKAALPFKLL